MALSVAMSETRPLSKRIIAVDLFCGVGGKTHGFVRAGIEVVAGVDIDPTCRYPYEHNNRPAKFIEKDISTLEAADVASWYPSGCVRVLIGCAPCQPFSTYSRRYVSARNGKSRRSQPWGMLDSFRRLVADLMPEIVTAENVPELARLDHRVYRAFVRELEQLDYYIDEKIVRCADYGVPQTRERLVVLASRLGRIRLVPPTHRGESYLTVRQAIGDLPPITAGGDPPADDPLHRACRLSALNLRRIKATPEGGGWQDWPARLRLNCHKRNSGKTYPSVYGRMCWDDLAPTLTTQCFGLGNGRFGHPEQHRAISLREAAILQTFPRAYQFVGPGERVTFKNIGRHIGNAVPVRLGEIIAQSIMEHLKSVDNSAI